VVKILEDVPADPDVLKACRAPKAGGCAIAVDDIVTTAPPSGFLDLADIVKVDFAKTTAFRRHQIARALRRPGTKILAEKVETPEDFNQALHSGYEYFGDTSSLGPSSWQDGPSPQAEYPQPHLGGAPPGARPRPGREHHHTRSRSPSSP
jgi:hypothetical protein